eukprot:scaffold7696_cov141-Cylindrotheca_fusiformis.AAC.11
MQQHINDRTEVLAYNMRSVSDSDSSSSHQDDPPPFNQLMPGENGSPGVYIPEDLPVEDGMIRVRRGLSSMISEISLGVDAADLSDGEEDVEELAPKKGMHQRGGLLGLLPLEEELSLSDESDDSDDESDSGGGKMPAKEEGPKIKGKEVMQVTDQIVNDQYGDTGLYTGSVTVEALVPHGEGILLYENSRIYDGTWEDGRWHGRGKWTNTNGDYYDGDFVNEKRHGYGTYTWPNGNEYIGYFVDDNRQGQGLFKFANGAVYEGEFHNGHFEGKGSYSFGTGMYDGEWKAGKYHGHGFLLNADGSSYTGRFEEGLQHGRGEENRVDGSVVEGIWTRGRAPVAW